MVYNLSLTANQTSYLDFMVAVNDNLMGGLFGPMILLVLTTIAFLAFLQNTGDAKRAFAGSLFISMGLSILLIVMGLLDQWFFFVSLILGFISVVLVSLN